jgi:hypothetical protein
VLRAAEAEAFLVGVLVVSGWVMKPPTRMLALSSE